MTTGRQECRTQDTFTCVDSTATQVATPTQQLAKVVCETEFREQCEVRVETSCRNVTTGRQKCRTQDTFTCVDSTATRCGQEQVLKNVTVQETSCRQVVEDICEMEAGPRPGRRRGSWRRRCAGRSPSRTARTCRRRCAGTRWSACARTRSGSSATSCLTRSAARCWRPRRSPRCCVTTRRP